MADDHILRSPDPWGTHGDPQTMYGLEWKIMENPMAIDYLKHFGYPHDLGNLHVHILLVPIKLHLSYENQRINAKAKQDEAGAVVPDAIVNRRQKKKEKTFEYEAGALRRCGGKAELWSKMVMSTAFNQ